MHRDLKPENLLLDENYNIKIVDFGLSNTYAENELLKTACGSPCYAAPEMIAGRKYNGLSVDICSCGVILFALLFGYLPFDDNDTQVLYIKIMRGEYSMPLFVSPGARDLLKNILNIHPAKRYTLIEIKNHPWFFVYKGYLDIQKGLIIGYNEVPVDKVVINSIESMGYDRGVIIQSIKNNRHNKLTTIYYLLLEKFIKNGHASKADVNSMMFRSQVLDEIRNAQEVLNKRKEILEKDQGTINKEIQSEIINPRNDNSVVSDILNQHRDRINKKVERPNVTNLNNTTLLSFEENLKDTSISPEKRKRESNRNNSINLHKSAIEGSSSKKQQFNITQLLNLEPVPEAVITVPEKKSKVLMTIPEARTVRKTTDIAISVKNVVAEKSAGKKQIPSVAQSRAESISSHRVKPEVFSIKC